MPEGDSVGNRGGNLCNIDKLGNICQTKRASCECLLTPFLISHPIEQSSQKIIMEK